MYVVVFRLCSLRMIFAVDDVCFVLLVDDVFVEDFSADDVSAELFFSADLFCG